MSTTEEVVRLIERRGSATVDDLMPDMPGYTREQVRAALQWATYTRKIACDGGSRKIGGSRKGGSLPATYRAVKKPIVASVWQFAEQCQATA